MILSIYDLKKIRTRIFLENHLSRSQNVLHKCFQNRIWDIYIFAIYNEKIWIKLFINNCFAIFKIQNLPT